MDSAGYTRGAPRASARLICPDADATCMPRLPRSRCAANATAAARAARAQGVADFLVSWIPLYYPLKLGFILWLQLPSTQGATRIYMQFVQPQLKLHEGRIDGSLDQARSFATTSVQDIRQKGVATWGSEMLQRAKSSSAAGGSSAQQDNSAHVA